MSKRSRSKGEGSSKNTEGQSELPPGFKFNGKFFSDPRAQIFYEENENKGDAPERGFMFPQRGFNPAPAQYTALVIMNDIAERVRNLGWSKFTEHPKGGNKAVVREFYANLPYHNEKGVKVRKFTVPCDSKTINELYDLDNNDGFFENTIPNDDEEDEIQMQEGNHGFFKPTDEQIITTLCNSSFIHKPHVELRSQLRTTHLTLESKMWYYFITSRLIPTLGGRVLGAKRTLLLWCIMTDTKINVGKIIMKHMLTTRENAPFILNFPTTIYSLCQRAGAKGDDSEEKIRIRRPFDINYAVTEHKKVKQIEEAFARGENEEEPESGEHEEARQDQPMVQQPRDAWQAHVDMRIDYLETLLTTMMRSQGMSIPTPPAGHPRFAPPARQGDEGQGNDDMDDED